MNAISDRTIKIMQSSIICDSLSHGPFPWSQKLIKETDDLLEKTKMAFKIVPTIVSSLIKDIVRIEEDAKNYHQAWIKSGVDCVSCTVGPLYSRPYSYEGVRHNFAHFTYLLEQKQDFMTKILKAEDIVEAKRLGKKGMILSFQSLQHIKKNIDLIDLYYLQGIKIMQLTYNTKNAIGTGCTARKDTGLSRFGEKVVDKMNNLGIVVDISHCGTQTSWDALNYSQDPIMATHTFSKALNNHDRGKTDKYLKAIADKKGYIGVLAVAGFLTPKSETTIDDWLNHVDYIVDLVGVDHVGIGSDFYAFSLPPNLAKAIDKFMKVLGFKAQHRASFLLKVQGFESYAEFPNFIEGLINRGYSDTEIKKLAGENFLRVFKQVCG
jgi:membrane dipeptidase